MPKNAAIDDQVLQEAWSKACPFAYGNHAMAHQKPWKKFEVTWKTVSEVARRLHSNCNQQYEPLDRTKNIQELSIDHEIRCCQQMIRLDVVQ